MKIYPLLILAPISIFLLMGIVSANHDAYSGVSYPSFAVPLTCEGCMNDMNGKMVNLYYISRERSKVPSAWYMERGGLMNVITLKCPYDIVQPEVTNAWAVYTIKMYLDERNQVQNIQFFRNSVPVSSIPAGLWDRALKLLNYGY